MKKWQFLKAFDDNQWQGVHGAIEELMNITTTTKLVDSIINVNGNVQFENIYYVDMSMSLIITTNAK
jgi:hypothetical protein